MDNNIINGHTEIPDNTRGRSISVKSDATEYIYRVDKTEGKLLPEEKPFHDGNGTYATDQKVLPQNLENNFDNYNNCFTALDRSGISPSPNYIAHNPYQVYNKHHEYILHLCARCFQYYYKLVSHLHL